MSFADMDMDLTISLVALLVSALTGIVGMWIERDPDRGLRVFVALATLCMLTTMVSMYQAIGEARDAAKQEEAMANVLQKLDTIMQTAGVEVPAINDLVKTELASASRENPALVKKVAQRVADSGGNPASVLGSYLPADEVKRIARTGTLTVKKPAEEKQAVAAAIPTPPPTPRKALSFDGPAQLRAAEPTPAPTTPVNVAPAAPAPAAPAAEAPPAAEPTPAAAEPAAPAPAAEPQPPAAAPAPTPKPAATKPVVRKTTTKPAARGDVDIYEEAEQDIRRTTRK